MAISDYLTEAEWDGCYYVFSHQSRGSFNDVIHQVVPALYEKGYQVQGLTADCTKIQTVTGNNTLKLKAAMGNETKVYLEPVIINGRNFIKQHLPELIKETDEQWEAWIKETESNKPQTIVSDKPRKRSKA
jgi:hypothetical protein